MLISSPNYFPTAWSLERGPCRIKLIYTSVDQDAMKAIPSIKGYEFFQFIPYGSSYGQFH